MLKGQTAVVAFAAVLWTTDASAVELLQQERKIIASDADTGDRFGGFSAPNGMAASNDTLVVGASQADSPGIDQGGRVYVFTRTGSEFSEQQILEASDRSASDQNGWSVDIDGDSLVFGAIFADAGLATSAGAAYVFTRSNGVWTEQQKLTASDAAFGDRFGFSVSIDGDTIAVGSPEDDDAGGSSGSVYVFTRSGTTWTQQQKLTASNALAGDELGYSVSLDGDTVAIGAWEAARPGNQNGAVYIFDRVGTTWTETQELNAGGSFSNLGRSVELDGGTLIAGLPNSFAAGIAGRPGLANVYTLSAGTWSLEQTLSASDPQSGQDFGWDVDVMGDRVIVGAYSDDLAGTETGAAYVFLRSGSTWTQQQKLTALDAQSGVRFGYAVSAESEWVAAAAPHDDGLTGAAYSFGPAELPFPLTVSAPAMGSDPAPAPDFAEASELSSSSGDLAFIGGAGGNREGVYKLVGGQSVLVADAGTAVPGGTGTFLTNFIDVASEGSQVVFSSGLGIYSEDGGPLAAVADTATPVPGRAGNFDTFGKVIVTDGDIVFQGGTGGVLTGIYRDDSGVLGVVADDATTYPGAVTIPTAFFELAGDQGEVAFTVDSSGGQGVFKESAGTITLIADEATTIPGGVTSFLSFEEISILAGEVAFVGIGSAGIYEGDGVAPLRLIVDDTVAIPTSPTEDFEEFDLIGHLSSGNIAFIGFDGTLATEGIFEASAPTNVQTVVDASSPLPGGGTLGSIDAVAIDGSTITFVALDTSDLYIDTFEVTIGSAATSKPLGAVAGAQKYLEVGRPVFSGDDLVFAARTSARVALFSSTGLAPPTAVVDDQTPLPGLPAFVGSTVNAPIADVFPSYDFVDGVLVFSGREESTEFSVVRGTVDPLALTIPLPAGTLLPGGTQLGTDAPEVEVKGPDTLVGDAPTGVYTYDGSAFTVIADTTTADPDGTGTLGPDFSRPKTAGTTSVFIAEDTLGRPGIYFANSSGGVELIANGGTADPSNASLTLGGFSADTAVALSGSTVAFVALDGGNQSALYIWSGGALSTAVSVPAAIENASPVEVDSLDDAVVDIDNGVVVFTATDSDGMKGVYYYINDTIYELVREGDIIPGGSAAYQSFESLDLAGDMVAVSATDDGQNRLVAVAEPAEPPTPVPFHPLTAAWLAAALFAVGRLRSDR